MKTVTLLSLALLIATPAAAQDGRPAPRKPGLWTLTTEGGPYPGISQMCTDAESDRKLQVEVEARKARTCSRRETLVSGNTITEDAVCKTMGSTRTTHRVTTIVDDETRVTIISYTYEAPKPGSGDYETKTTIRWVGPCGDLKPGQIKLNNGKVFTVADP